MTNPPIKIEKSPFENQRNMTAPQGSVNLQAQVSTDLFNDFIKFAERYNVEHDVPKRKNSDVNKSAPLKHILTEFLNSHPLERQCFKDLNVIVAFNIDKFETPFDTPVNAAVIGFVQHPETFTHFQLFRFNTRGNKENKSKILYVFEHFNEQTFNDLNLKAFNREVLFNIPPSIHGDFEAVRERLQELHPSIDFDNADICMFNLNNYLDTLHDGVYMSNRSTYSHEGFVVIFDPDDIYMFDRIVARFNWSYISGFIDFEFNVEPLDLFNTETIYNTPENVQNDYWSVSSGFLSPEGRLTVNLQNAKKHLENYKKRVELYEQKVADITAELDRLKKQ